MNRLLFLAAIVAVAASCTVLEDRDACPRTVRVLYEGCTGNAAYYVTSGADLLLSGITDCDKTSEEKLKVAGNVVTFAAAFDVSEIQAESGRILLSPGEEPSEIMGFVSRDLMLDEFGHDIVVSPCRQTCRLVIRLDGYGEKDLRCVVESSAGGLDLHTMMPLRGEYKVTKEPVGGVAEFVVFRQDFDDLRLRITERIGSVYPALSTFSLTPLLEDIGYDWDSRSLQDIMIEVKAGDENVMVSIL